MPSFLRLSPARIALAIFLVAAVLTFVAVPIMVAVERAAASERYPVIDGLIFDIGHVALWTCAVVILLTMRWSRGEIALLRVHFAACLFLLLVAMLWGDYVVVFVLFPLPALPLVIETGMVIFARPPADGPPLPAIVLPVVAGLFLGLVAGLALQGLTAGSKALSEAAAIADGRSWQIRTDDSLISPGLAHPRLRFVLSAATLMVRTGSPHAVLYVRDGDTWQRRLWSWRSGAWGDAH